MMIIIIIIHVRRHAEGILLEPLIFVSSYEDDIRVCIALAITRYLHVRSPYLGCDICTTYKNLFNKISCCFAI
jgi:hypothetical protein